MSDFILAIDQGTTSSRAIIFDRYFAPVASHQIFFQQFFPQPGWVEHDAMEIWRSVKACCDEAIKKAKIDAKQVVGIGITNQRETTVVWRRDTGEPVAHAIVWQDRRTADFCQQLKKDTNINIAKKTGLLLDPYFSASKIHWLLQHHPELKEPAENGELAFGTIDTWILWNLTDAHSHATDATNASRTLLFNIHTQQWDDDLLELFSVPKKMLPSVKDNCSDFGVTDKALFGAEIPIFAMAGDQQAALIGQACFKPGMVKSTYGTGIFLVLNTGEKVVQSTHSLLSTVAYRLNGKTTYAMEGSVFSGGVIIKWLRDTMGLINDASESEQLANQLDDTQGVVLVPAFTGLGAPYWDPDARAAIFGMTRGTKPAHIVRAGLEAVAYQTLDLIHAMRADGGAQATEIRVDGGMTANNWLLQFLADMINHPVVRSEFLETTALGVAYLAGIGAGWLHSIDDIENHWREQQRFIPAMSAAIRQNFYQQWQDVVMRTLTRGKAV